MRSARLYAAHALITLLPPSRGFAIKRALLRWCGARIGEDVRIASSARFLLTGPLSIGEGTWLGQDFLVAGGDAEVRIGARVDIGPRVTLVTGSHAIQRNADRAAGPGYSVPITIEDGAWIGASATVLGGVTLGRCCIVAAGALVKDDVPAGAIVAGVPARALRPAEVPAT
jgi:maltose O-acetyltransferase